MSHRHFGFPASSPPSRDKNRYSGNPPAFYYDSDERQRSDAGHGTAAAWPRYILDPGAQVLRREPAESSRQLSAAEEAIAVSSQLRHRADRRETFWIIGILVAAFVLLLLGPAIVS